MSTTSTDEMYAAVAANELEVAYDLMAFCAQVIADLGSLKARVPSDPRHMSITRGYIQRIEMTIGQLVQSELPSVIANLAPAPGEPVTPQP